MKTKEELLKEVKEAPFLHTAYINKATLEVLIDIRDQLEKTRVAIQWLKK